VQVAALSACYNRRDLFITEKTGGGKTVAMLIGTLIMGGVTFLCLPTRRLVADVATKMRSIGVNVAEIVGSQNGLFKCQLLDQLENAPRNTAAVIIATPENAVCFDNLMVYLQRMAQNGRLRQLSIDEVQLQEEAFASKFRDQ